MGGYGGQRYSVKFRPAGVGSISGRRASYLTGISQRRMGQVMQARASIRRSARVPGGVRQRYYPRLRRASAAELNYVDLALAAYPMDSTGSVTLIATIAQGTTVNQRIGKKAQYRSILLRGTAQSNATCTVTDCAFLIIYDKRPTGSLPAITDILTASTSRAFMNDNNTGRFQVVRRWDNTFIGNTTTLATGEEAKNVDMYIPFRQPITFESAGTGAIGDIDMGALYLVTVGSTAAGTAAGSLSVAIRTRFTE